MLDTVDHFKFRESRIDFVTNDNNILALELLGPKGEFVGNCYVLSK